MLALIQHCYDKLISGHSLDRKTALRLAAVPEQSALWSMADEIRSFFQGNRFHLCSIINARSGNCTENCRFCAQSARYHTGITTYKSIDPSEADTIVQDNEAHGIDRLSLVTSGHSVDLGTLDELAEIYKNIRQDTGMERCASMGFLDQTTATRLAELGVTRYHCNLETSQDFFTNVCTSHRWTDKVATLQLARQTGMSLCSGGIIGMGETMEDRINLAFELHELAIKSIPINILTPISGTPFADKKPLPLQEVLTTISLFRLINPQAVIRMAGGRQQLGSDQYRCFTAGANGAIVGNYLTTTGSSINQDLTRLSAMGFTFARASTAGW
jgi:biotin synthase